MTPSDRRTALLVLLIAYAAASLLHHVHNGEFLADYPNLPAWLTRTTVYLAWSGMTALGGIGYLLFRRGHVLLGLSVIAVYASLGFDSLAHYALAPFGEHTTAMNLTIGLELASAALLLVSALSAIARPR